MGTSVPPSSGLKVLPWNILPIYQTSGSESRQQQNWHMFPVCWDYTQIWILGQQLATHVLLTVILICKTTSFHVPIMMLNQIKHCTHTSAGKVSIFHLTWVFFLTHICMKGEWISLLQQFDMLLTNNEDGFIN